MTSCIWGVEGCNCWADNTEYQGILAGLTVLPLGEFSLADLGLSLDEPVLVEDDTLARVIAEVRAGSILMPEEGEALLDAYIEEQTAHSETLADNYELEDELAERDERIAELEAIVARQNALLGLAKFGIELSMDTILGQAAEISMLRFLAGV